MSGLGYISEGTSFLNAASGWATTLGIFNGGGQLRTLFNDTNLSELVDKGQARINLGLQIGTDVQAHSANLDRMATASAVSDLALVLISKATTAEWATTFGDGIVSRVDLNGGTTGLTVTGGPITQTGTLTLGGTLSIAHGGTGVTSLVNLRKALDAAVTTTFANLPSASAVGAGARWFITDGTSVVFNDPAAGGGSNKVPVFSDGTGWFVG